MFKLIMALILSYTLLSADNIYNFSEEELFEPTLCEKSFNNCMDECDSKDLQTSFSICISDCSTQYEECVKNGTLKYCKGIYKSCSFECANKSEKKYDDTCLTKCEQSFDNCVDNSGKD